MPDHLRQPHKNAMGPRSPNGSDSPLSLVMGRNVVHHVDHHLIHNKTPPPPPFEHTINQHSNGSTSGYSDGESPIDSPLRELSPPAVVSFAASEEDEQPLSLVVPKKIIGCYDSGHDDCEVSRSPHQPQEEAKEQGEVNIPIKIKDFAKFNLGEDAREKMPHHAEQTLLAALTAPPKARLLSETLIMDDTMSEVSSMSSMSELMQGQRIGDHTVYPCDFCDKVFGNKYHLGSHLIIHTGERSFECRYCQKYFGRKSTLRAHMTTHTKMSNFMCPLCEKACNDNNSLEEHIRMHTGEKPFVCTICAKAYARKSHLNVHYRVHTGERPFVCVACGKDFTEKRFLNDHMQTAHSGNDGPLKCPNCYREFAYKTSLKQHLKKQMCEKNLNRGQGGGGSGGHGVHAKQFACPFCEKSYSWKQTLKQHVSMYHRNKVHTDEFWKYELAKHRRTVLDSKTNEDMWKKQLGKHADEIAAQNEAANMHLHQHQQRSRSSEVHNRRRSPNLNEQDRWLDQIQRTTASDPMQNNQVSQEMKLLALQSLQNSLHLMSMKLPLPPAMAPAPKVERPPTPKVERPPTPKVERPPTPPVSLPPCPPPKSPQPSPSPHGYLSLLAHISAQRKAEDEQLRPRQTSESSTAASSPPYLPEMKEESAAKRTQMWLAQLGRYRKNSIQDEMDRNHDELWEEQIAKVKGKPVKSPLEPIEINLEDVEETFEDVRSGCKAELPPPATMEPPKPPRMIPLMSALQCQPPPRRSPSPASMKVSRPPTPLSPIWRSPAPNVISIKTSAIHRVENQPRTFSLSLEMNNNNCNYEDQQPRRHIPLPLLPTSRSSAGPPAPVMVKRKLLEIPDEDVNVNPTIAKEEEKDHEESNKPKETEVKPVEDSSVLKSLLMDRMTRKRPQSPVAAAASKVEAKRPSICGSNSGESDILRRRLLGLKAEQQQPQQLQLAPKPRFQPPSATITSQQLQDHGQSNPVDLSPSLLKAQAAHIEAAEKQAPKSYTQTSVLKHLLYRYEEEQK